MSTYRVRIACALGLVAAFACNPASAQWSDDPATNITLADGASEQVQSKMVPTPDGGFYVSWFDNSSGGYDVYLQRLDADGNEQFPHNGILIADRDFSSTEDYGLDIDADGNALLAYRLNDGNQVAQIVAQKVAPDGSLLWTPGGIVLSSDDGGASAPKIAASGDGTVGVSWTSSAGEVVVQKLSGAGTPLWGPDGIVLAPASGFYFMADLHGDADGNLIVSWVPYIGNSHQLWAQKLAAADGADLWGSDPVEVFDGSGGALQFGNFPPFIADGAGGAVFVWYTVGATGQVHVQHILADGSAAFAQNGSLASSDTSTDQFEPSGAYDAGSGDTYVIWRQTDILTQSEIGVSAQRIDSTGERQWGDSGMVLVAPGSAQQSQLRALPQPGGFLAAWTSNDTGPMPIHVALIEADGSYGFPGDIVDIKTAPTDTSRLTGATSTDGYAAYAWTDAGESFSGDLKAQNINLDGTLGTGAPADRIFANGFD
jgi:hypothetical protein